MVLLPGLGRPPDSVRDGHARVPPWRERLAADPGQSLGFLRALDDLAARFGGGLPALAGLAGPGRLLDVGGGAGSHAATLARAVPGLEATVLDLPNVEPVLRERHPELAFVPGNLDQPRFGRPPTERWDAVLLASVLHDHPAERCRAVVTAAVGLLTPGGTLLVYEWVLDEGGDIPPAVALFDLMMLGRERRRRRLDRLGAHRLAAGGRLTGVELRRAAAPSPSSGPPPRSLGLHPAGRARLPVAPGAHGRRQIGPAGLELAEVDKAHGADQPAVALQARMVAGDLRPRWNMMLSRCLDGLKLAMLPL
jgi:O-methyltransferase domain